MLKTPIVLFLLLTKTVIVCEWLQLQPYNVAIPAHTYQVQLEQNDEIYVSVYCALSGGQSVFVMIYPSGVNLLGNGYIRIQQSHQYGYMDFSEYGLDPGTYYVRVKVVNIQQSKVTYNINVNSYYTYIYTTNYFCAVLMNKPVLNLPINLSKSAVAVRYTYAEQATIVAYNPIKNSTLYIRQQYTPQCLSAPLSDWVIIVNDTLAYATGLTTIRLQMQYNTDISDCMCSSTRTWNAEISECEISVQIRLVIGFTVAIFVFGLVYLVCYFKRKRERQQQQQQVNGIDGIPQSAQSLQNMKISQNLIVDEDTQCSICLSNFCNAALSCRHYFHLNCIKQWLRRNNQCPICRTQSDVIRPANLFK